MKNTNTLWMNNETGELLTYKEMRQQAREWYGLDDDTNACDLSEYYTDTGDPVPEGWEDESEETAEPLDIDDDFGFDPYAGCFTWDC